MTTMKAVLLSILCLLGASSIRAAEEESVQAARAHVKNIMSADSEGLKKSYALEVVLMPGHEFLKPDYGLANDEERKDAVKVTNIALIAAILKKTADRPMPQQEKLDALLGALRFELVAAKEGDLVLEPSDEVATPDGKLHFTIRKDDVVLKMVPPKGDFAVLHLRKSDDRWMVVSEYLD
jgi:hypothetical protein